MCHPWLWSKSYFPVLPSSITQITKSSPKRSDGSRFFISPHVSAGNRFRNVLERVSKTSRRVKTKKKDKITSFSAGLVFPSQKFKVTYKYGIMNRYYTVQTRCVEYDILIISCSCSGWTLPTSHHNAAHTVRYRVMSITGVVIVGRRSPKQHAISYPFKYGPCILRPVHPLWDQTRAWHFAVVLLVVVRFLRVPQRGGERKMDVPAHGLPCRSPRGRRSRDPCTSELIEFKYHFQLHRCTRGFTGTVPRKNIFLRNFSDAFIVQFNAVYRFTVNYY